MGSFAFVDRRERIRPQAAAGKGAHRAAQAGWLLK
jgi:hypothetical protein